MNRSKVVLLFALFACAACHKHHTAAPAPLRVPYDMDSLFGTNTAHYSGNAQLNVSGIFVSCVVSGNITDTSGKNNYFERDWAAAVLGSDMTTGDADISLNTDAFVRDAYNSGDYSKYSPTDNWNNNGTNGWFLTAGGNYYSALVPATSPKFTDTLPATVSLSSEFSINFNASNCAGCDSAFVCIYDGGALWLTPIVSCQGGTAIVPVNILQELRKAPFLYLNDNDPFSIIHKGGILMIVLYKQELRTINGKQLAFIRQREIMRNVLFE